MSGTSAVAAVDAAASIQDEITNYVLAQKLPKELREANEKARQAVESAYTEQKGYYSPYYKTGTSMYQSLADMVKSGKLESKLGQFNYAPEQQYVEPTYQKYQQQQFNFESDPGYQWRLQQGMNAVQNSAAARGAGLSGATMAALQKYGQGFASNEYQNAFNRNMQTNQQNFGQTLQQNQFLNDVYNQNRNFGRNQYTGNRAFEYGKFSDQYNADVANKQNIFNQYNTLGNYGYNAGVGLANAAQQYGDTLADLAIQRGNIDAGEWQMYADASHAQAQDARNFVNKDVSGMGGSSGGGNTSGNGYNQYLSQVGSWNKSEPSNYGYSNSNNAGYGFSTNYNLGQNSGYNYNPDNAGQGINSSGFMLGKS